APFVGADRGYQNCCAVDDEAVPVTAAPVWFTVAAAPAPEHVGFPSKWFAPRLKLPRTGGSVSPRARGSSSSTHTNWCPGAGEPPGVVWGRDGVGPMARAEGCGCGGAVGSSGEGVPGRWVAAQ